MEINWVTVSAQIVNFVVLVALLRRFLYRPVLDAMDRRQSQIRDRLSDADARRRSADRDAERLAAERGLLEKKRDEVMSKAAEAAERERRRLLEAARMEVAETRAGWRSQVEQEQQEYLLNLQRRSVDAIKALVAGVLRDLADASLQTQVVKTFIRRLEPIDEAMRQALVNSAQPLKIKSAFPLEPVDRNRLTRAVHEHLADDIELRFTEAPELGCGIELVGGSARLSWNLDAHLEHLQSVFERPARTRR